jgi:hypothetical protein
MILLIRNCLPRSSSIALALLAMLMVNQHQWHGKVNCVCYLLYPECLQEHRLAADLISYQAAPFEQLA